MNPDFHKTAETITWTLKDSEGNLVKFKLAPGCSITIEDGDELRGVDKEKGRRIWKEYMDKGFRVQNKCVDHDMKKFYASKRKEERNQKVMKSISDSMDEYLKKIHDNDLQEMRVNPKKLYTDNWDNYALQA